METCDSREENIKRMRVIEKKEQMLHEAKAKAATESCDQRAKPWDMSIEEKKAKWFRLGEAYTRQANVLEVLKDCLGHMNKATEFVSLGRDYALAITHLEDSITRMERAVIDMAKSIRDE